MRVGVIAGEMEGRSTGVGRYLSGLLTGLAEWDHRNEWHLFFQGEPFELPAAVTNTAEVHFSGHHGRRFVWEHFLVSSEMAPYNFDLVFGPANTLPFGCRTPAVVTIHDLSFEEQSNDFSPRERWRRRLLARRASRVARRVFTVSRHMAELLCKRYRLPENLVAVVPNGVDLRRFSAASEPEDEDILASLGVRSPYVLWAGTVLERRLPGPVVQAFAAVRRSYPDLKMVIAGENRMRKPGKLTRLLHSPGLDDAVHDLGWVGEGSLAPLYRGAELGIYLSLHEGFGIPPLECLACGTPVVVSEGLALDDAWPDYPYRVTELTAEDIEDGIRAVLDDGEATADIVARAKPVIASFDWQSASRRLVAEMKGALTS